MYLRVNDASNENYSRIGQIIFRLKDDTDSYIATGVRLSGIFANNGLYDQPDFNGLVYDNWSITKDVGVSIPTIQTNTWHEILKVPSHTVSIHLDDNYSSSLGDTEPMHWYYMESGDTLAGYSDPGIPKSQIQVIN